MGERICVLKEGVIQQVDTPTALYDRPANAFVASFIGSPEMNIHAAELSEEAGRVGLRLRADAAQGMSPWLPLSEAKAAALQQAAPGRAVRFGLRPEHIGLAPRADGRAVPVSGVLRSVEHMGNEGFVHFSLGELPLTARVPAEELQTLTGAARGAAHTFHLQLGAGHLFDAASGARLC